MSSSQASLSYVTVGTNDPAKARLFYAKLMAAIGATQIADYPDAFGYELPGGGKFWIMRPHNRQTATAGNGVTIGLAMDSESKIIAAHAAALQAGGVSEGDPGPRPLYGPDFFGGYVRDLDGNKLALVHHRTVTSPST
jgi:catechol 2,3-dioxygenase-like lactoylglutathione lyase family enzyme